MPVTTYAAKYAAKKFLRKDMDKNKDKKPADEYDPYFTMIKNPKKPGKFKKVRKQVPEYIPEDDAMRLAKIRRQAYRLDCCLFSIMGIRFGWSSVIGLVPAVGDVADLLLSAILVRSCLKVKCGIPPYVVMRMLWNIFFDFAIGLVPFVGDLIDAGWRANTRNVRLLEEVLDDAYNPAPPKEKEKIRESRPATVYEDFSEEEESNLENSPIRDDRTSPYVSKPQPARVPTETRGGERTGGLFGKMGRDNSRRERPQDVEIGRDNSRRERPRDVDMGHPDEQEPSRSKSGRQTRR